MEKQTLEKLRGYIARCRWVWSKTMPDAPHEYIMRGNCPLRNNEFSEFVRIQANEGKKEYFYNRLLSYLYIDGYKYWTMSGDEVNCNTINRQKVFECYDTVANPYTVFIRGEEREKQMFQIASAISKCRSTSCGGSVFEIGAGDGSMLDHWNIDKSLYQAIEPSKVLIELFRERHPEYTRKVRRKAFEEDSLTFTEYDNVVALFGTASYIMRQYLERLSQKAFGKQCVFLMFYKPGYIPPYMEYEGACIPHFDYGVNEIVSMFRWCKIIPYADYLVVTNMNIDWEWVAGLEPKKRASEPVQTSLF